MWGDVQRLACRGSESGLGAHRIGWGGLVLSAAGGSTQANQGAFVFMCLLCLVVRRIPGGERPSERDPTTVTGSDNNGMK